MRALVIGGTGFVGLAVVDALLAAGHQVRVTRRKHSVTLLVRKRPVELVDASLDEPEKLRAAMEGCDVVFLAGAHYPRYSLDLAATLETGLTGVRNACDAALAVGVPRLVYTSSIASLGPAAHGGIADEHDIPKTMPEGSVYRAAKWAMEREIEAAQKRGLNAVTLLPGGCIGPGDLRVGTGAILVGCVRGMLPWWVDGMVNLIDIDDVAKAHVRAASPTPHDYYCLAGHTVKTETLLRTIAKRFNGVMPTLQLSADEARARAEADEREAAPTKSRVAVPRELVDMALTGQVVSNARAEAELGLDLTPMDRSLERAYDWFVRFRIIPRKHAEKEKGTVDELR